MAIEQFKGPYSFLSNFALSEVELDGERYRTVEHAYQAAKTLNNGDRTEIRRCITPGQAKKMGREVVIRNDWEEVKVDIMRKLLKQKFSIKSYEDLLYNTRGSELIEGNTWNDTFWGVCNGQGKNTLGKLLMETREEINKQPFHF